MSKIFNKELFKKCNLFDITNITLFICVIALFILKYVFVWGYVPTESMYPTIEKGDKVGIYKMVGDIKYGDIIVFKTPNELKEITNAKYLCKRVIATGGQSIEIKLGTVYIDGKPINEEGYAKNTNDCTTMVELIVPEKHVFVMGDNRENSYDSRYWEDKFVDIDEIVGVVRIKLKGIKIIGLN